MEKLAMLSMGYKIIDCLTKITKELDPDVTIVHFLDDAILSEIAANDNVIPANCYKQLMHIAQAAELCGAQALLITCSSISEFADYARHFLNIPIFKIDEPMLRLALERGNRIGVVATIPTTLNPTIRQLYNLAEAQGKKPLVEARLVDKAYEAFSEGNIELHDTTVQLTIKELCQVCDVVVLAQASMVTVIAGLPDMFRKKVLSSPQLGIEAVLKSI